MLSGQKVSLAPPTKVSLSLAAKHVVEVSALKWSLRRASASFSAQALEVVGPSEEEASPMASVRP